MELHSPVKSKQPKLDVASNNKDNTVIIDENSPDPDLWIDYRDHVSVKRVVEGVMGHGCLNVVFPNHENKQSRHLF